MISLPRRLLPLIFLGAIFSQAKDFEWSGRGTLSLDLPDGWELRGRPSRDTSFDFTGRPESKVAAYLQITVIATTSDDALIEGELPDRLRESVEPYIEQSVEKEFRPINLKCRQGKGWYAEITDANLVGKPPVPDDYKVMRSALILLDRQTLVVATMQFDDPKSDEAGEMLAIVASLRIDRWTATHTVDTRKPESREDLVAVNTGKIRRVSIFEGTVAGTTRIVSR